jgi:hypothetical protein
MKTARMKTARIEGKTAKCVKGEDPMNALTALLGIAGYIVWRNPSTEIFDLFIRSTDLTKRFVIGEQTSSENWTATDTHLDSGEISHEKTTV